MMAKSALDVLFWGYKRVVSPFLHSFGVSQCVFLPTCSEYAYGAIARHGWIRGTGLALRRLGRCHPLSKGGLDPVP
jgi:putative membrane protein insertion efficiency factor